MYTMLMNNVSHTNFLKEFYYCMTIKPTKKIHISLTLFFIYLNQTVASPSDCLFHLGFVFNDVACIKIKYLVNVSEA